MENNFKILLFFGLFFSIFNCLNILDSNSEPSLIPIEIKIQIEENQNFISTKEKSTLYFNTNFLDNEENIFDSSDIETLTSFMTLLQDENGNYHKTI